MEIIPAIDLLDGECVRLQKGDYNRKTVYSADPVSKVLEFESQGSKWLHIVDLSGAKDAKVAQIDLIKKMVAASKMNIQVGGGVRTKEQVRAYLDAGVSRVVVGSLCVKDKELTKSFLKDFGKEKIVLALDVKIDAQGKAMVAASGWQEDSNADLVDVLEYYKSNLSYVLCTDIARDGMLEGPNVELYQKLNKDFPSCKFIASGGVSSLEDLALLEKIDAYGVVIGKALYENKFTLKEALTCLPKE